LCLFWCYAAYLIGRRYRRLKLAVLPMEPPYKLESSPNLEVRYLAEPNLHGVRYDGLVADLRGPGMTPEWERFLARCILAQIPVFHVRQVAEQLSGRVRIDHLSENEVGT